MARNRQPARRPKLLFLVTEDWYFWSHRLPVAHAARDAGFDVVVATRVRDYGERIRRQGFRLVSLPWRRRGNGVLGHIRALAAIAALYRRERPDIVHHVALKPVLFGAAAVRLAFPRQAPRPLQVAAVTGLGSGFTGQSGISRLFRSVLARAIRRAASSASVIVQNPEDGAALAGLGVPSDQITLIRGSGVDTRHFAALPEPAGAPVVVALVARMLRSKGVAETVAAVRLLRDGGLRIALLLAGPVDPDNPDSFDDRELAALAAAPGIEWLGRVEDVRAVWQRAVIAVLPSTYGEGVPKALLEAAACGRPIVATDTPGCREIVRPGETGLLVPPHDVSALAAALAALATDSAGRQRMGCAARALAERDFSESVVAGKTLSLYRKLLAQCEERG